MDSLFSFIDLCVCFYANITLLINIVCNSIRNQQAWYLQFCFFCRFLLLLGDLLWFKANFRIVCSISGKNAIEILIRVVLKSVSCFGQYGHLNSFFQPMIMESFHLFVPSLISFINILQFSVNRSFTFSVNFMPRYFIPYKAM